MEVDLHMHSVASDGTYTVSEIFDRALKNRVRAIALTDHDTIDGLKEGIELSKKIGLEFIPGIELSCNVKGLEVHVLGYFLNLEDEKFIKEINDLQQERDARNMKIIEKFKKVGIIIDIDKLKNLAPGNIISRLHFANYLIKEGIVNSKEEAFIKYLGKNGIAYVPKENFPPEKAVDIIKANGGIASLAHPLLITEDYELLNELIISLKNHGLDALEANYSLFSKIQIKLIKKIAKKHGLEVTGGSDFHGDNRPGVDIGCKGLEYEQLEKLKKIKRL